MFSQQINTEAQTGEDMFTTAIKYGAISDTEVDDPIVNSLADALDAWIQYSLLH